MNGENVTAILLRRQIHEENFVESSFADNFWRQAHDVIRRGDQKDRPVFLGHPREQGPQNPPRQAVVITLHGDAFFDFVHPKDAGRHYFGGFKGFSQVALGFAVIFIVKDAKIQPQQRRPENAGGGLGGKPCGGMGWYLQQRVDALPPLILRALAALRDVTLAANRPDAEARYQQALEWTEASLKVD